MYDCINAIVLMYYYMGGSTWVLVARAGSTYVLLCTK